MICWWIYRSADIGWLKAAGLVLVRQMSSSAKGVMFAAPNDLWCADYKGEFRLGNHAYCYPLTVTDQASRFLPLRYPEGVDGLFSKQVALIASQAEFSPSEHVSVFGRRQIGIGTSR